MSGLAARAGGSVDASRVKATTSATVRRLPGGECFRMVVDGVSMEPALRPGDEIVAIRGASGGLGDLVVVELPEVGLVAHRLLWNGRTHVRTRGDGSGRMDPPVAHEDVLGTIREVRRAGTDVTPGLLSRRATGAWHFTLAALYRLGRRWTAMAATA